MDRAPLPWALVGLAALGLMSIVVIIVWSDEIPAAAWGFVGVVAGGLITGYVAIRAERIRADNDARMDSARRQDDRRIDLERFQSAALIELQDIAARLVDVAYDYGRELRSASQSLHREKMRLEYERLLARVQVLASRVVDAELNEAAEALRDDGGRLVAHDLSKVDDAEDDPLMALHRIALAAQGRVIDRAGILINEAYAVPPIELVPRG